VIEPATTADLKPEPAPQPDPIVRCRACSHAITSQRQAIEVNRAHEHTFRNPAGYSFHVLCYRQAPGALRTGTPTTLDTWFPGYAWSYALCQECQVHLGWFFQGEDGFAGLIATRLLRPYGPAR
jgi:hypothetical protein